MRAPLMSTGGSILPHLILPGIQILALALPPFRHRAVIFVPTIFVLVFLTWVNLFSPTVDTRVILLAQWPWYLGTVDKLLFARPEEDYWRHDHKSSEALSLPWLAKWKWAAALYCSPRGVGWNYQVKGVPPYRGPHSKAGFVLDQAKWLAVCVISIDALHLYSREYYFRPGVDPVELTSYSKNWVRSFVNAVHGLLTPYFGLNLIYGQLAIVCVLLGLGSPQDWAPLYGRMKDATTLRRFWNTWWHQCVRKVYVDYSRAMVSTLGFKRGTWKSSYAQLYFSFLLSGTGHGLVIYGMPHGPRHTAWDRFWSFWLCFALQAVAIHLEDFIIWYYWQLAVGSEVRDRRREMASSRWQRVIGRLWVLSWCWIISVIMVDPCLKLGIYASNPLAFSVLEPLLRLLNLRDAVVALIR